LRISKSKLYDFKYFCPSLGEFSTIISQSPQCEGKYDGRFVFTSKISNPAHNIYRVATIDDDRMQLEAGEVQGVTKNARFDIYRDINSALTSDAPLQRNLFVSRVRAETAILSVPEKKPLSSEILDVNEGRNFVARMTCVGDDMIICVHASSNIEAFIKRLISSSNWPPTAPRLSLVNKDKNHELAISRTTSFEVGETKENISFEIKDNFSVEHELRRLPHAIQYSEERAYPVLLATAKFFYHLRRDSRKKPLKGQISIEAYRLRERLINSDGDESDDDDYELQPDGENLCDMNNRTIQVKVPRKSKAKFGFKIKSEHESPLYVWAFLFNMSDLSISETLCISLMLLVALRSL
jgi:hypothetical protein